MKVFTRSIRALSLVLIFSAVAHADTFGASNNANILEIDASINNALELNLISPAQAELIISTAKEFNLNTAELQELVQQRNEEAEQQSPCFEGSGSGWDKRVVDCDNNNDNDGGKK